MMQETLMTEQPASSEAPAVTQKTAQAEVTATETGKNQQVADATSDGDSDGNSTDATKTEEVKSGAPEKYEFKAPDGRNFDNEVMHAYSEVARELNLSQESAQKMLDRIGPKMAEQQIKDIQSVKTGWLDSSRVDKEFGGDNINTNMSTAKRALDTFGTPELKNLLNETGLGNHPEVIRFFFRAGKSISEDTFVGATSGSVPNKGNPRDFAAQASMLYSNNS